MAIPRPLLVIPLACVVAGCPADEPAVERPYHDPVEVPLPQAQISVLQDMAGMGVTGELMAMPANGDVEIVLVIQNALPNESLDARVHTGSCEMPGPELVMLDPIVTDAIGHGISNTRLDFGPDLIMDGAHIAAIYGPDAAAGLDAPIACAAIPAHHDVAA
jgi:hypothetical protein